MPHSRMPVFLMQSYRESVYNSTVGTLFSGYGKYYSDNPAAKDLEELRDQVGNHARHDRIK